MLWLAIFFSGIGTFLMRSAGVWLPSRWVPTRLLTYLPLAVILVMATISLISFVGVPQQTLGMAIASFAVILASIKKLPLFLCIGVGCFVFGALTSL